MSRSSLPDKNLIALGIRQPWAELIVRGIKTVEVRSLPTQVRGPIYLYASRKFADHPAADLAIERFGLRCSELPTGLLIGTVEIVDSRPCTPADAAAACVPEPLLCGKIAWELANPRPLETFVRPRFLPYGVWFYPFVRQNGAVR